jgi:glycine dehydrogenase
MPYFDTITIATGDQRAADIVKIAEAHGMNFRLIDDHTLGISLDEATGESDVVEIWQVFKGNKAIGFTLADVADHVSRITFHESRTTPFLTHPVFNSYHSETEMLRYIKRLESRDLSLTASMIPLGSCTMKLNAAAEMLPISWPEFARLHPFAPLKQARGYQVLFQNLEDWLAEITGFAGISLQPNAGSQGEYAGQLVIRAWHESRGEAHRNICLIPTSAHGTNPASAVMAGLKVVAVACDQDGNIDVADLRAKAEAHKKDLACLMVTYPSTHGVFEETIKEICEIIHANGGQVYMDGANLNAQVGLCRPADIGADVCHLNLHKTFAFRTAAAARASARLAWRNISWNFSPAINVVNLGGENPIGAVCRRAVGQRGHSADFVDVYRHDGRGRPDRGHPVCHPERQLHRQTAGELFPDALPRPWQPGCARVHSGFAPVQECHRRGRGQAADGLRFSRADAVLAGRRHADGRADRKRIEGSSWTVFATR